MRSKHLVITTAAILGLSTPFMGWTAQTQSEPQSSPGTESGMTPQGGMPSQNSTPLNPAEKQSTAPSEGSQTNTGTESGLGHGAVYPNQYVDKDVINKKGDKIGEVHKLVINNQTKGVEAVIGVGGLLGVGEKKVALPIEDLQPSSDKVVLNTIQTEDELKQATPYNNTEFRDFEPKQ